MTTEHPLVAEMKRCQQCGSCCRHLIVDVDVLDVIREPRIAEQGELLDGRGKLEPDEWMWSLVCVKPCPFLGADNRCAIYPTRPEVCLACRPGGDQCILARRSAGLSPIGSKP